MTTTKRWEPVLKRHWYAGAIKRPDYVLEGSYATRAQAIKAAEDYLSRCRQYELAHGESGWPRASARLVK